MNEEQKNELLIRLDTRQASIDTRLEKIEDKLSARLCFTHAEKIKTLEKIVWGSVMLSMAAILKSFWSVVSGNIQ